jgi:putative ABC transport system permease protein
VAPRRLTLAMTVVVGIVLLVTAANAAGMLLARGVTRSGELAVRLVLGATGRRIARQLVIEGMLLSVTAGAFGLMLARWLIQLFRSYTPERFAVAVSLDASAWIFTALLCAVTGGLVSIAPAVQSLRLNLTASLPGVASAVRPRARGRLRYGVVIPQIALSLMLLVVASLHLRTLLTIEMEDLGYSTSDAVVVNLALRPTPDQRIRIRQPSPQAEARFAERSRLFYRQLLTRIQPADGSEHVALASRLPLSFHQGRSNYAAVSHDAFLAGGTNGPGTEVMQVSPGYFRAMNMRLTDGRDFDERDSERAAKTAIVSERLAAELWPGRRAIGHTVAAMSAWNGPGQRIEWLEVVGVVNEVRPILQDNGATPYIYLPMSQQWRPTVACVVSRTAGAPAAVQRIRAAVPAADPFADVTQVQSMAQIAGGILYPRRLAAAVLGASAAIALVLASIGLYSVVSYSVAQRTHEIGVRTALGARRADILRMIVRDSIGAAAAGGAVGFVLSYLALRLTANLFVNMPGLDATTLILVPLALAGVVALACYVPARRALAVDPMDALRTL